MTEEEDILRFREARLTWKHWFWAFVANVAVYWIVTAIRSTV